MSDQPLIPALRTRSHPGWLRFLDRMIYSGSVSGALCLVALLVILLAVIFHGAYPVLQKYGSNFLFSNVWHPNETPLHGIEFGGRTFIYSTLVTSAIALAIAFPISLGSAIFLTKLAPKIRIPVPAALLRRKTATGWTTFAPRHLVATAGFLIELLAAIPSIAYGLWGIVVLVPFMAHYMQPFLAETLDVNTLWHVLPHWKCGLMMGHWPLVGSLFIKQTSGFNMFSASVVLAIMVTPIITAIIRDVLAVVPPELEQGALGLGATWWQAMKLVIGYSKMGIFGAVILGFARATGETMAVTMIIGNSPPSILAPYSIFTSGETIAAKLANQFNNASSDEEIQALICLALVLLAMSTFTNGMARLILMRVTARKRK